MTDRINRTILSIKVTYSSLSLGIIGKKNFITDIKFKEILDYYTNSIQPIKPNTKLKPSYYYNGKEILDTTNIKDLLSIDEDIRILDVTILIKVDDILPPSTRKNISIMEKSL